jgi:hypothetical protein
MPFIGNTPSAVPLTSADIADGIITSAKIVDGTIVNADINASAGLVLTKLASTGTLTVDNIQFPATQVASANANNLDDYEEGTWTPSFTNLTTNSGTPTFAGAYTKIGRIVNLTWNITGTKNITMTADSTRINNLPIASNTTPVVGLFTRGSTLNLLAGTVTSGTSDAYFLTTLTTSENIFGNMVYIT